MHPIQQALGVSDLANLLGVKPARLTYILYAKQMGVHYTKSKLPKKSGGTRNIASPSPALSALQRRAIALIEPLYKPPRACKGFRRGVSIVDNAEPHVRAEAVVNVDLRDFFPTINFGRVRGVLIAPPYAIARPVATALAQLFCLDGSLPQGAPSSPLVSNIVSRPLDGAMRGVAAQFGLRYTRYADDITFSTSTRAVPSEVAQVDASVPTGWRVGAMLANEITKNGFELAQEKTTVRRRGERQEVTGLVVNERVNVRRSYIRRIRAAIHDWSRNGEASAQAKHFADQRNARARHGGQPPTLGSLLVGKLNFVGMVRGIDDAVYRRLVLKGRGIAEIFLECPILDDRVFVLHSDVTGVQATGFLVDGVGLVTAAHAFDDDISLKAFRWDQELDFVRVKPMRMNRAVDIAICRVQRPELMRRTFRLGGDPARGEPLRSLGFPRWGSGDEPSDVAHGPYAGKRQRPHNTTAYILTSNTMHPGSSGGPVLTRRGTIGGWVVAGSYRKGAESPENLDLCIGAGAIPMLLDGRIPNDT